MRLIFAGLLGLVMALPAGAQMQTTAEVKPILQITKGNWVAVREYDGKDLLYVTHLFGWRCGLAAMAISVNGETMQNWPLPPCHMQYATPNALLADDGLPMGDIFTGGAFELAGTFLIAVPLVALFHALSALGHDAGTIAPIDLDCVGVKNPNIGERPAHSDSLALSR